MIANKDALVRQSSSVGESKPYLKKSIEQNATEPQNKETYFGYQNPIVRNEFNFIHDSLVWAAHFSMAYGATHDGNSTWKVVHPRISAGRTAPSDT